MPSAKISGPNVIYCNGLGNMVWSFIMSNNKYNGFDCAKCSVNANKRHWFIRLYSSYSESRLTYIVNYNYL